MEINDEPISSSGADRLDRNEFVEKFARRIYRIQMGESGLVIGLNGEWGAGKTSIVNLVLIELHHLHMLELSKSEQYVGECGKPLTLEKLRRIQEQYSEIKSSLDFEHSQLNYVSPDYFNRRVTNTGSEYNSSEELYRYFRLDYAVHQSPRNIFVHFAPWMIPDTAALSTAFIRDMSRSLSTLREDLGNAFGEYSKQISDLAPIVGSIAELGAPGLGGVMKAVASAMGSSEGVPKSLFQSKADLEKKLVSMSPTKIIVVIDDLDRLSPDEAAEMIGLVKGLGDLPNVLYLLSYDRDVLSKCLQTSLKVDGNQYLEKIVQYERRVPPIRRNKIIDLLNFGLNSVFENESQYSSRLSDLWTEYLSKVLKTPRDIKRILSAFSFSFQDIGDFTDPVDLLVLEVISAKQPDLYEWIRENLDLLCGSSNRLSDDSMSTLLEGMLEEKGINSNQPSGRALSILFPKVAEALDTYSTYTDSDDKFGKAIRHLEFAFNYFDVVPPKNEFSRSFLNRISETEAPKELLKEVLEIANSRPDFASELRSSFLDELVSHFGDGTSITLQWVNAIVDLSPMFIGFTDHTGGILTVSDNFRRLARAIFRGLDVIPEQDRFQLVSNALNNADDISVLCNVIRIAIGDLEWDANSGKLLGFAGMEAQLREQTVTKVVDYANTGKLWQQARPSSLIWFWRGSDESEAHREFMNDALQNADDFPNLVEVIVNPVFSTEGDYETVDKHADTLVSLEAVESKANLLVSNENEQIRKAAKRFLIALKKSRDPDWSV